MVAASSHVFLKPLERITPRCSHVGACGGCSLQDLAYAHQLAIKRERLAELLRPLGLEAPAVVGADDPWRYRNKAEFSFGSWDGRLVLGYHAANSYRRVVDLEECWLSPEPVSALLRDVRGLARASGAPAYSSLTHQGFFRHLLVRSSRLTGQLLACLVTAPGDRSVVDAVAEPLRAARPELAGFAWGIRAGLGDTAYPDSLEWRWGGPTIEERIGPFTVAVHPFSFLQPNLAQAEKLYARVSEWSSAIPPGTAWDCYGGMGVIGLYLAQHHRKVYVIDSEPHNVELARANLARDQADRVELRLGRAEALFADKRFWFGEAKPDVVVVDPPRAGLHARVTAAILGARPRQIIYVSCHADAFVRDAHILQRSYPRYRLTTLEAFDLFPHTRHVELLARFELK